MEIIVILLALVECMQADPARCPIASPAYSSPSIAIPRISRDVVLCAAESIETPAPMPTDSGRKIEWTWRSIGELSDSPTLAPTPSPIATPSESSDDSVLRDADHIPSFVDSPTDEPSVAETSTDVEPSFETPPGDSSSETSSLLTRAESYAVPSLMAPEGQYRVASTLYKEGRWTEAARAFRRVFENSPSHPLAAPSRFFLSRSYLELGEMERASDCFRDYLVRHSLDRLAPAALYRIGEIDFLRKDHTSAKSTLTEFMTRYKDNPHAEFALPHLGELAYKEGDLMAAARWYREAIRRFPDGDYAPKCRLGLARTLDSGGYKEAAREIFEELARVHEDVQADEATFYLGVSYYEAGDYEKATVVFARFEDRPTDGRYRGDASLVHGWALLRLGRVTDATDAFHSAARFAKTRLDARYWLAVALCRRKEWAQAYHVLTEVAAKARKERPKLLGAIRFYEGFAAEHLGRFEDAYRAFDGVLACTAIDDPLRDDALLRKADAALCLGDWSRVDEAAGQFLMEFPNSSIRYQLRRIWARSYLGRKEEARAAEVLKVGAADPKNRLARLDRTLAAAALLEIHKSEAALAMLESDDGAGVGEKIVVRESDIPGWLSERYGQCLPSINAAIRTIAQARLGKLSEAEAAIGRIVPENERCVCGDTAMHRAAVWRAWNPAARALAEHTLRAGYVDRAAKWYRLIDTRPSRPEVKPVVRRGLAVCLALQDQPAEADRIFEELLESQSSEPFRVDILMRRGRLLDKIGRREAALVHFDEVIRIATDDFARAEAIHRTAEIHYSLRRLIDAETRFEQLVREYPGYKETGAALYQWGVLLEELEQPRRAVELFVRVKEEFASSRHAAGAALRVAEYYMTTKRYDRVEVFAAWVMGRGDAVLHESALFLSGKAAVAARAWDRAASRFDRFIERYPDSSQRLPAEFWRAEIDWHAGRIDQAEERFGGLIAKTLGRTDPWLMPARLRWAQTAGLRGDWPTARRRAESLIEDFPGFPLRFEADFLVGLAMVDLDRPSLAREAFLRVIRSPGTLHTETGRRARWQIGETYFVQNDYRSAIEVFQRQIDSLPAGSPWRIAAKVRLGLCHQRLGELKPAKIAFRSALEEADDRSDPSLVKDARDGLKMVDALLDDAVIR